MKTIEIRQNRRKLIPMICLLTVALLGMTYYVYFLGNFDDNYTIKILYIFLAVSLLYAIFIPTRKLIKDQPILTLSKYSLLLNEKLKQVEISWDEIINWSIEKDESTYYLNINTSQKKRKINISWLETKPEELEELIKKYRNG